MSDPLRNHRTEYLWNDTTFICSTNHGSILSQQWKGEPCGQRNFTICLAHPNTAFSREMVRRGVIPGSMWQSDTSQGCCHPPGKFLWRKNCVDKPAVTARAAFHAHVPARAIGKVFGSAAHIVVPAWLGQGILAPTDRREELNPPHANHSTALLSAWWLIIRLLINISLLTEPCKRSQQNVIWNLEVKGKGMLFYCFENCALEELNIGKCQELKMKCLKWSFYVFIYSLLVQWNKKALQEFDFFSFCLKRGKNSSSHKFSKGEIMLFFLRFGWARVIADFPC